MGITNSDSETRYGTLSGVNNGEITDCYAFVRSGRSLGKNVCGVNNGQIVTSFSQIYKNVEELYIKDARKSGEEIKKKEDADILGFNTDKIWEYKDGKPVLRFIDSKWKVSVKKATNSKIHTIQSIEDLNKFSEGVRKGDKEFLNGRFVLSKDIDCKGKKLSPIGDKFSNAFRGVFDGQGHSIVNFRIYEKNIGNTGFFGHLKGTVINLSLEGEITGEGNVGTLCGINEGTVSCCGVIAQMYGAGDHLNMGGIAGVNRGRIEKSYAAVSQSRAFIPFIPIGITAAGIIAIGIAAVLALPTSGNAQVYAPIKEDANQFVISQEDNSSYDEASDGMNTISFSFNHTLHVDPDDGKCYMDFKNPSNSTYKIVITIQADDGTIMAESGAVLPGRGLNFVTLNDDGYRLVSNGTDSATVFLTSYTLEDDSKAMIDNSLPVRIEIE